MINLKNCTDAMYGPLVVCFTILVAHLGFVIRSSKLLTFGVFYDTMACEFENEPTEKPYILPVNMRH